METPADTSNTNETDRILDDLWRKTISVIPSEMGKLVYLSSLRDHNSGRYSHYGLETVYSQDDADSALRRAHVDLFYSWLKKPLSEQKEDLEHYFRTVEGELDEVLDTWKRTEPFRGYTPADADDAGLRLFREDIGIILDLLEFDLFPPPRTAS